MALKSRRVSRTGVQSGPRHADPPRAIHGEAAASPDRPPFSTAASISAASPVREIAGIVIGHLTGIGEDGVPRVDFPGNPSGNAAPATSTVAITAADAGRQAALAFQGGDPEKPIILGLIQSAESAMDDGAGAREGSGRRSFDVEADGERITLNAEKEIVLRCGEASITLTRAGKVIIRGAYLISRASGVNRIKGGSVQIN